MARPITFISGVSGWMACGRNWRRHPILSSTSPTTAVNSLSRRFEKTTSSSILAILRLLMKAATNADLSLRSNVKRDPHPIRRGWARQSERDVRGCAFAPRAAGSKWTSIQ